MSLAPQNRTSAGQPRSPRVLAVTQWWNQPCGPREVLRISFPLIVSTISWTIMNFIDRMFLLWYDLSAMAAAMPAGMTFFTLVCFPLGVATYVNIFIAQYHGANRPDRIGVAYGQALWIGGAFGVVALAAIPLIPQLIRSIGHEPGIARYETIYLQTLMWGAGAMVISAAQSAFFTGRGRTSTVMIVDSSSAVVNIVLDYIFIFGNWGAPELGIGGAAAATVFAQWWKVGFYALLTETVANRQAYQLSLGRRLNLSLMVRLLRFGGPNGLQMLVDVAAITLFVMLVGKLGEEAMVTTTLAFNVNSVAFVPILGLGIAVSTIVGQQLGRDRPDLAARATWNAYFLSLVYTGIMALLYIAAPDLFLLGHASGLEADQFNRLRDVVVVLLRFVAVYTLLDATAIVFVSAIKGAGDTRFVLWITACTSPLPVIMGACGVYFMGWGLLWCWLSITGWIYLVGVIYLLRFLQGRWRSMRVIEPG